jgi:hypothetical protein
MDPTAHGWQSANGRRLLRLSEFFTQAPLSLLSLSWKMAKNCHLIKLARRLLIY